MVAVDNNTGEVLAVGKEARRMLGRTPGNIAVSYTHLDVYKRQF